MKMSPGMLRRVIWYKFVYVSVVLTASIISSINLYQSTRRSIPEGSYLQTYSGSITGHKEQDGGAVEPNLFIADSNAIYRFVLHNIDISILLKYLTIQC
jgi:hypothetical protein